MVTGEWQWYIIGCYISPENTLMIESFVAALRESPRGWELLVVGDFNADLVQSGGAWREEAIETALTAAGLEDMLAHFLPQRFPCCQDGRTWSIVRLGREVQSHIEYILGEDRRLFRNVPPRTQGITHFITWS